MNNPFMIPFNQIECNSTNLYNNIIGECSSAYLMNNQQTPHKIHFDDIDVIDTPQLLDKTKVFESDDSNSDFKYKLNQAPKKKITKLTNQMKYNYEVTLNFSQHSDSSNSFKNDEYLKYFPRMNKNKVFDSSSVKRKYSQELTDHTEYENETSLNKKLIINLNQPYCIYNDRTSISTINNPTQFNYKAFIDKTNVITPNLSPIYKCNSLDSQKTSLFQQINVNSNSVFNNNQDNLLIAHQQHLDFNINPCELNEEIQSFSLLSLSPVKKKIRLE